MNYYFNECEIYTDIYELRYKGHIQKMEPQIFRLLIFMLENPNRILLREELVRGVWNNRVISDSALNATISVARKVIGDSGSEQKYIKTVPTMGYRFIAIFTSNAGDYSTN